MSSWPAFNKRVPLEVIPCCADMNHFSLTSAWQKEQSRRKLGIRPGNLVLSYLGSVGTWYMLDEMLLFFKKVKAHYPTAQFLFVTHSARAVIDQKITEMDLIKEDFIITQAARNEVPFFMKASDITISFIQPVYSKISSSPTKLGEVLSMGIPVIANSGVGDVQEIVDQAGAGYVLEGFSDHDFEGAVRSIPSLLQKPPAVIREAIKDIYSLESGIQSYLACYRQILS
jgi:glycosyltransferase involved in cell wall biosynthesis